MLCIFPLSIWGEVIRSLQLAVGSCQLKPAQTASTTGLSNNLRRHRHIHMLVRNPRVSNLVTMPYSPLGGKCVKVYLQPRADRKTTPDTKGKGGGCDRLQAAPETIPTILQSMAFILTDRMQLADQFWTAIVSVCYSARSKYRASCHVQSVSLHFQFGDLGLKRCRKDGACCDL